MGALLCWLGLHQWRVIRRPCEVFRFCDRCWMKVPL